MLQALKFLQLGLTFILAMLCSSGCSNTNIPTNIQDTILNVPFSLRSATSVAIRKADITGLYGEPAITRQQKDYSYEIRVLSDGSKFFIVYDNHDIVSDMWRVKELFDRSAFEQIAAGKSRVEDVKKIDPYFQIFEYANSQETAISEHRLKDGGLLTIGYKNFDSGWVVDSVVYAQEDPSGFVSKILPEDQ